MLCNRCVLQAFVDKFSRDLSAECRAQGITVQTVHPGKMLYLAIKFV